MMENQSEITEDEAVTTMPLPQPPPPPPPPPPPLAAINRIRLNALEKRKKSIGDEAKRWSKKKQDITVIMLVLCGLFATTLIEARTSIPTNACTNCVIPTQYVLGAAFGLLYMRMLKEKLDFIDARLQGNWGDKKVLRRDWEDLTSTRGRTIAEIDDWFVDKAPFSSSHVTAAIIYSICIACSLLFYMILCWTNCALKKHWE